MAVLSSDSDLIFSLKSGIFFRPVCVYVSVRRLYWFGRFSLHFGAGHLLSVSLVTKLNSSSHQDSEFPQIQFMSHVSDHTGQQMAYRHFSCQKRPEQRTQFK